VPATLAKAPPLSNPALIRAAISAIPTGSFAPDSPSRKVPLGPSTPRCPRTENTSAGSVGETAVATSHRQVPAHAQKRVHEHSRSGHRGERPDHPEGPHRRRSRAHLPGTDVQAGVEQDHDQREGDDPLDR
jgi:hypothetical protein